MNDLKEYYIDFYNAMVSYLPWYDQDNIDFQEVLKAVDIQLNYLEQRKQIIYNNLFLDTANEKLHVYEKALKLKRDDKLTLEQRRNRILARRLAAYKQTTKESIQEVVALFLSHKIDDIEISQTEIDGVYEIGFPYASGDLHELNKTLRIMIPAHLMWILKSVFKHNLYFGMYGKQARHSTMLPADFITDYNNDMYFAYYPITTRLIKTIAINPPIEDIAGIETLNYGMHTIRSVKYITTQIKE